MSTRWYPIYRRGNPQLRVFLPNFWMKLVKPREEIAKNIVCFHVSPEMTKLDVKNYLEKIYKVPVMTVHTINSLGKTHIHPSQEHFMYAEDNYKVAHVTLPKDYKFEYPEIIEEESKLKEEEKAMGEIDQAKKIFKRSVGGTKHSYGRKGVPSFFGL